jgi:microcompartment protein CcmL/EutN
MLYKIFFVSGSTDILEAESAAEARDGATKQLGRVKRVMVIDEPDDGLDDDLDEEEDADEEENEGPEGEGEEGEVESEEEPTPGCKAGRTGRNRSPPEA